MEDRIHMVELELAKLVESQKSMDDNLKRISKTLETMVELQTSTQLLNQRVSSMDKNMHESFKRVYGRIEKLEATHSWVAKTLIGTILAGIATISYSIIE